MDFHEINAKQIESILLGDGQWHPVSEFELKYTYPQPAGEAVASWFTCTEQLFNQAGPQARMPSRRVQLSGPLSSIIAARGG